ncbi:S9 family peptidase [Sphingomonas abietis]|uniref:S9 family peptidase n=1 Tax=Sphingomonas abietis TaxID=3012344 RepID=A0ABY7NPP9_9SPHN|nr:S9 family peptidase [Sphingomonas abietis]WBO23516.1 S9 family peptidase [Sphingomonas abietis]
MGKYGRVCRLALLAGAGWGVFACGAWGGPPVPTQKVTLSATLTGDAADLFGSRETIWGASLSPDGSKVLFLTSNQRSGTQLMVASSAGGRPPTQILQSDGTPMTLRWCDWADDSRIVCDVTGSDVVNAELVGFQRLMAIDVDGKNSKLLSQQGSMNDALRISQFSADVIDWNEGRNGKLLMARDHVPEQTTGTRLANTADGLGVDMVDTHSLAATKVEAANPSAIAYIGDGKGAVRLMATEALSSGGNLSGVRKWFYRRRGSRNWEGFSDVKADGHGLRPLSVDYASDTVYCLDDRDGRDKLYRVALDGSMKTELIYADPKADVDDVLRLGRQARLIGAATTTDQGSVAYFDPEYQKLAGALSKALPNLPQIEFVGSSADETKLLLSAGSDTDPGRYYVFDKTTKHLNEIALVRPQLENVPLATMTPVTFKAADGTVIPAYLTLPPSGPKKGLPAIVMPHGGPASHDNWGFDWLVQFFAHQGYAVLQPEFRGSTGYGDDWMLQNGFKSWRTAIGDVTDAGRWLVAQGIAAPDKLAIVGWSYGGYAALQSNVLDPDLFKAVVAIAPVTDLDVLRSESLGFTNHNLVSDFIGSGAAITDGSPARHAAMFKAPVILFHGTTDQNVGVGESRLMNDRLRAAGKQSSVVIYPNLDHQLPSGEIRADMLRRADAFLRQSMHLAAAGQAN